MQVSRNSRSGALEIKLPFYLFKAQLDKANTLLNQLHAPKVNDDYGKTQLKFTKKWTQQEESIKKLFDQYVKIVNDNIIDTEINVKKLKEQDETIAK